MKAHYDKDLQCSICTYEYDKQAKIPRMLKCGHTFCETCLKTLKGHSQNIICPNCRKETKCQWDLKLLPENYTIFSNEEDYSPLRCLMESAGTLSKELATIQACVKDYNLYLDSSLNCSEKAQKILTGNFEKQVTAINKSFDEIIKSIEKKRSDMIQEICTSLSNQLIIVNSKYRILKEKQGLVSTLTDSIKDLSTRVDALMQNESVKETDVKPFEEMLNKYKDKFYMIAKEYDEEHIFIAHSILNILESHCNTDSISTSLLTDFGFKSSQQQYLSSDVVYKSNQYKRPKVILFTQASDSFTIHKFDLLDEKLTTDINNFKINKKISDYQCCSLPNNSSLFFISSYETMIYDFNNRVFLVKPHLTYLNNISGFGITSLEKNVYIIGGKQTNILLNQCFKFNLITEKWVNTADLNYGRAYFGCSSIDDFQICAAGGEIHNEVFTDSIELYNQQTNKWKSLRVKLPFPIRNLSVLCAEKNKILIIGGEDRSGTISQFIDVDLVKKQVIQMANLSTPLKNSKTYYFNSNLFVVYGDNGEGKFNVMLKYNFNEKKWVCASKLALDTLQHLLSQNVYSSGIVYE